MPAKKLREFLDSHGVEYVTITHSPAYTAQKIAASAHVPGKELAKTVMVRVGGTVGGIIGYRHYGFRQVELGVIPMCNSSPRGEITMKLSFAARF